MTRVSVAMCSCNRGRFIQESLAAFVKQTRLPDEVVVADDGSDDGTVEVVESFARDAPFALRLLVNPGERLGLARNYDRAIGATTGDVVALCDDDDVWVAEKLATVLSVLETEEAPLLVFSDAALVDERLRPAGPRLWRARGFGAAVRHRHRGMALFDLLARTNVAYTSTIAFRDELKRLALPIPAVWKPDRWLTTLAAASGRAVWIDAPLVLYRQHAGNAAGFGHKPARQQWAKARADGVAEYQRQVAQAETLRARLAGLDDGAGRDRIFRLLDDKIEHLQTRIAMRKLGRPRRLALVARELLEGRYHSYTLGYRSALKDAAF